MFQEDNYVMDHAGHISTI